MKKLRKRYDRQMLQEERQYGFFWYDWLWKLVRPVLVGLAACVLVAGILLTGWQKLGEKFFFPVDETDQTPVTFVVESGSSLSRVTANLKERGLIRNAAVLRYYMDFQGMSQKVQTGEYTLSRSMSLKEISERLTAGDGNPITMKITIIPGWNVEDIAAYLMRLGVAESEQAVRDMCNDADMFSAYYYIADVLSTGTAAQRLYLLEGYLAPDTYEIYTSATLESVIKKLLSQVETVYDATCHDRAEEIGMTMDEVITLASMIEKEAKAEDFAKVSAVFHNRLDAGMTLGSDVTVQYATHSDKMALTSAETGVDSPYNTYKNQGLPVGPICSPSKAAITAALYPDETYVAEKYLYFCSTSPEEGTLYFSKTLEEHNAAVAIYRPLWEAYDRERGM